MTARQSVKKRPRLVGVITSAEELRLAARMRPPPDFFELRLDHLCKIDMQISDLPAPLIITARHPREGGANKLSIKQRRELLAQFLDRAAYIDIELRSVHALESIVDLARRKKIGRIISFHDFDSTPSVRRLSAMASKAKSLGADIFKAATRTDTQAQLARLRDFAANAHVDLALAVMGIGKFALASRVQLPSVFVYGALKTSRVAGQPTLAQLRSALRAAGVR
ncbi:MAG: 3-dehydroquinate dehydratase [Verrucomicrobiota bacterium]|jgi:3-dehydroquinate dehydratase-1